MGSAFFHAAFMRLSAVNIDLIFDAFNLLNGRMSTKSALLCSPDFIGPIPEHYKDGAMQPIPVSVRLESC